MCMLLLQHRLSSLLHQCATVTKDVRRTSALHAFIVKLGLQWKDVVLCNHLLNSYCKCGDASSARKVFEEMPHRNLVSWSALISGCGQLGRPFEALELFKDLHEMYPVPCPNEYVFASILSSCCSLPDECTGKQVHANALKFGFEAVIFVANALITMYMGFRLCGEACRIFDLTGDARSSVSWNALITGLADNKEGERGLKMLSQMHSLGFVLDRFTFMAGFTICSYLEELQCGKQLHCTTIKYGLDSTAVVANVMMTTYSNCNHINEAEGIFWSIVYKDMISWNTIISACSHCSDHERALELFKKMAAPDDFSFATVLASCAGLASISKGRQIHAHLFRTRSGNVDAGVGNALINMYAKCGDVSCAFSVFNTMPNLNLVSWNSMIGGFSCNGCGHEAIKIFERMRADKVLPDSITFVGLLSACDHVGLVTQAKDLFDSMQREYGIGVRVEHVACLVNLFGRAGRLSEAEAYAEEFDDPILWGSLLSACHLHGDVGIGTRASRRINEIHQISSISSSSYVLLSNMCAADGSWESVAELRKMMKQSGVKKEVGNSWIEIMGVEERFSSCDLSHSRIDEILTVLRGLGWSLKSLEA